MPHFDDDQAAEMEEGRAQIRALLPQIHTLIPNWSPTEPSETIAALCYSTVVTDALDHAASFDLESLFSGPFYDYVSETDYYLEAQRDPTEDELRAFQAQVFLAYIEAGEERFDHLPILRRTLPMIKATVM